MHQFRENILPVTLLVLAVFPTIIIAPIDRVYLKITGTEFVDITYGMIAYLVFMPMSLLIISANIIYRVYSKKIPLKDSVIHLACFILMLFFTITRFVGYG
ncbi:hypothetical protein [Thalassotalea sediminis]|uniref:hypothetical protein n=1 Tax=Thalassotalea sediminis TaxID=1759089 RepID=UPI002572EEF1|nr:hypothetical protein [Thalassotalea sediminis]